MIIYFDCKHFYEMDGQPADLAKCPVCLDTVPLPTAEDMKAGKWGAVPLYKQDELDSLFAKDRRLYFTLLELTGKAVEARTKDLQSQLNSFCGAWIGHMLNNRVQSCDIPFRAMASVTFSDKLNIKKDERGNVRVCLTKAGRTSI